MLEGGGTREQHGSVLGAEEVTAHVEDYQYFVAAQKLRKQVSRYLDVSSEGWVPSDVTQTLHQELYSSVLHAISSATNADDCEPIKRS